jgi:hypothetical protein
MVTLSVMSLILYRKWCLTLEQAISAAETAFDTSLRVGCCEVVADKSAGN